MSTSYRWIIIYVLSNYKNPNLENPNKIVFSIYAAAVMMNLVKKQRDSIGLSVFTDKIEVHTPSKTTQRHHRILYKELDKLLHTDIKKQSRLTNSTETLHQISELLHRRSLVMIFTDFIHPTITLEDQFEAFKHMKYNKHEVVIFYIYESATEMNLKFDNMPYEFIDIESKQRIKLNPNLYKEKYQEQTKSHLEEVKSKCFKYKIDFVEVDINQGFEKILNSYLLKRQKIF